MKPGSGNGLGDTPSLALDLDKVRANCGRLRGHLARHGVMLRPHAKTAKSVEVTRIALDAPSGPVTVSTLKEAEHFFAAGFSDILYAVGITPGKFERAAALRRAGCDLKLVLDNEPAARALCAFCQAQEVSLPALIEIDTDDHRAGVPATASGLPGLGILLAERGLLAGVMTHAGNSYGSRSTDEIRDWARREREGILQAASRLRDAGLEVPMVSLGSTPTAFFGDDFAGVTEVRAGVYMFFDLVMAGLGVCAPEEIALSVAVSVIGHQADKGWIITDGGWMALSRDRGTQQQAVDQGYGLVCDEAGKVLPGVLMTDANQEHGILARRDGQPLDPALFPLGRVLRILPNHACATAAQHGGYHVLENGSLTRFWERFHGW